MIESAVLLAAAVGSAAIDRASKRMALGRWGWARFSDGPRVLARPSFARFAWLFFALLLLACVGTLVAVPGPSPVAAATLTGLAFGGAASNLLEARRRHRGVDFIPVLPFAAVNLADVAIGAGLAGRLVLLA